MEFPILRNNSLDWPEASYECDISIDGYKVTIENTLSCPPLEELIVAGDAKWVVELRSPYTLYSQSEESGDSKFVVIGEAECLQENFYIRPVLCSVRKCKLDTTGLSEFWAGRQKIDIPEGVVLAEDDITQNKITIDSILKFSENEKMDDGVLQVHVYSLNGNPRFQVDVSSNTIKHLNGAQEIDRKNIYMGGFIGGMAKLKGYVGSYTDEGSTDEGSTVLSYLRTELEKRNINTWDEDDYDPLHAATALKPYELKELEELELEEQ